MFFTDSSHKILLKSQPTVVKEGEIKFWDENDIIAQHPEDCETTAQTEETVWTADTTAYHQQEAVQRDHPTKSD